jgi:hypothetical protein
LPRHGPKKGRLGEAQRSNRWGSIVQAGAVIVGQSDSAAASD